MKVINKIEELKHFKKLAKNINKIYHISKNYILLNKNRNLNINLHIWSELQKCQILKDYIKNLNNNYKIKKNQNHRQKSINSNFQKAKLIFFTKNVYQ